MSRIARSIKCMRGARVRDGRIIDLHMTAMRAARMQVRCELERERCAQRAERRVDVAVGDDGVK